MATRIGSPRPTISPRSPPDTRYAWGSCPWSPSRQPASTACPGSSAHRPGFEDKPATWFPRFGWPTVPPMLSLGSTNHPHTKEAMLAKVAIHLFGGDDVSLNAGPHVAERIRQVAIEQTIEIEVSCFGPAQARSSRRATARYAPAYSIPRSTRWWPPARRWAPVRTPPPPMGPSMCSPPGGSSCSSPAMSSLPARRCDCHYLLSERGLVHGVRGSSHLCPGPVPPLSDIVRPFVSLRVRRVVTPGGPGAPRSIPAPRGCETLALTAGHRGSGVTRYGVGALGFPRGRIVCAPGYQSPTPWPSPNDRCDGAPSLDVSPRAVLA